MKSGKAYPGTYGRGAVAGGRGVSASRHGAGLARLQAVRQRFEVWRKTHEGRARIPEGLWTSAVKLAATYGLCRIAQTLGLNYTALKKHVEAAGLSGHEGLRLRRISTSPDGSPTERRLARSMSIRNASTLKHFKASPRIAKLAEQNPAMTFVELARAENPGRQECMIELEHPRGAKMRIHLTGNPSPEVIMALSKVFFGVRA